MKNPVPEVAAADATLLDVKLLRLFDLLHATGSVTRAAEHLGQSQPTVSIWLSRLRTTLHDPLFVRTPGGMKPTPRADGLIATVREALDALRRLSELPAEFAPASSKRRFRICMTDASHVTLLTSLLAHVRATAPNTRLEAARIDSDTGRSLQAGEADLALGLIPDLEAGFHQQTLFEQDWVCLANARHPRLGKTLSLKAYREEAHIGIVHGTGHRLLDATLKARHIERRVLLELPGFLGLPAIVSTTDLIATLPRQIGEALARTGGSASLHVRCRSRPSRSSSTGMPGITTTLATAGCATYASASSCNSRRGRASNADIARRNGRHFTHRMDNAPAAAYCQCHGLQRRDSAWTSD